MLDFKSPATVTLRYHKKVGNTKVTAFFENAGHRFVATEDAIYSIHEEIRTNQQINIPEIYSYFTKRSGSGVRSQNAVVNVNADVFFYDGVSVRSLSQSMQNTIVDTTKSLSIQRELDCLIREQRWASMTFEYPYVKLWVSEKGGYNDIAFIYNVENDAWSKQVGFISDFATS